MGLLIEWLNGQKRPAGAVPLLAVEAVSVRLGQRLVLDDVSLEVYEGEQVRITGPNDSAGKEQHFPDECQAIPHHGELPGAGHHPPAAGNDQAHIVTQTLEFLRHGAARQADRLVLC